jgi:hypothetical protein
VAKTDAGPILKNKFIFVDKLWQYDMDIKIYEQTDVFVVLMVLGSSFSDVHFPGLNIICGIR